MESCPPTCKVCRADVLKFTNRIGLSQVSLYLCVLYHLPHNQRAIFANGFELDTHRLHIVMSIH